MSRNTFRIVLSLAVACAMVLVTLPLLAESATHTTGVFSGAKVNRGTVTHSRNGHDNILTMSPDFEIPDTPDPHWQVVDSKGKVYRLDRLKLKDDRIATKIVVPAYVPDVAKVQIWCAWAEALLGEASFQRPIG